MSGRKETVLDLAKFVDKGVQVKLTGGRQVTGTLKGYDQLLNLVLDEAVEFLRGSSVILSPKSWKLTISFYLIHVNNSHLLYTIISFGWAGLCNGVSSRIALWGCIELVIDIILKYADDPLKTTDQTRRLGLIVCRGTAVMLVSPTDGTDEIANPFVQPDGA
ncbi:hypothetical protein NC651_022314 [Populus alba x Populus x berolinensis]|nr:hypothetical protein NC651_022306 [Populus alba x Populus x berolinensis]KAJ6896045.1 hypothetical protein NC651_022314 [Populus alba x Populus x berolinensis]